MTDTCARCGAAPASSARWCGHCGARLAGAPERPGAGGASTRDAAGGTRSDHALVGAGTTTLAADPDDTAEVEASATGWSPRARLAALVAVVLVVVVALLARSGAEVVHEARGFTARGDAARSGVVSLAPLRPPTTVAWTADVGAALTTSTVRSAGDLVLEQTGGGLLAARDAATGDVRWLRRDVVPAGVAVRVGDVVAVPERGRIRGLSVADGAQRWELPSGETAELVPSGSDVLASSGGLLRAVDPSTGDVRWEFDGVRRLGATIRGVVAGRAGVGVWLTTPLGLPRDSPRVDHLVALLDPATGELRRETVVGQAFRSPPVAVGDEHVAVASVRGVTISRPDGTVVHHRPGIHPDRIVATGHVLAVARLAGVSGHDLATGRDLWSRPDLVTDQLVAVDGLVVAGSGNVVDAATGRSVATLHRLDPRTIAGEPTVQVLPAVAGSELELRDRDGRTSARAPLVTDEAAAPAVGAARVFVPTRDGVQAFAVADGTRDWAFGQLPTAAIPGGGRATARTPAVAGTTVLVTPGSGTSDGSGLVALHVSGGVRAWDRDADAPPVLGPLTLAGDVAFVPVGREVHGYEAATGRRSFAAVAGSPRGPLVVGPNRVIGGPAATEGATGGEAVAILRRDRSESWRTPLGPCSGPVLTGERVAWGTSAGVTALDERTGEPVWRFPTTRPVCLDPVAARGRIVVVEDPGTLHALPAGEGGPPLWSTEVPAPVVASPVVAGDHLLVVLLDGTLAAYDLDDGTHAWSFDLGGVADASPAVLDGHVLVHLRDGRLLALAP